MTTPDNDIKSTGTEPTNRTLGLAKFASGHSRKFKWLIFALVELIIFIGVFALGLNIGFRKAGFTYSWASHYKSNFGAPQTAQLIPPPPSNGYFNPHGVFGQILSANGTTSVIIKDSDSNEKTILLSPGAVIRQDYQTILPQNLKAGEQIVVIGEPNDQGQIQAKFIRIIDQN